MANLSYCRFQNTLSDLQDCYDNLEAIDQDGELSPAERNAAIKLIKLCSEIARDYEEAT